MGNIRLYGSTSGYVEIAPPAIGGSQVLTLPTDSVQPGLVLINTTSFSAASTVSVNNCFSSTYNNYKVLIDITGASASTYLRWRLRASSVDAATAYFTAIPGLNVSNAAVNIYASNVDGGYLTDMYTTVPLNFIDINFANPYIVTQTKATVLSTGNNSAGVWSGWSGGCAHGTVASYDGFSIYPISGTITGTLRVYGYRNS